MNIPFALLEQCLWEGGIRRLFDNGILYIENLQDKLIKLARGVFKHHTTVANGHVKNILEEAFRYYLKYDVVSIED